MTITITIVVTLLIVITIITISVHNFSAHVPSPGQVVPTVPGAQ